MKRNLLLMMNLGITGLMVVLLTGGVLHAQDEGEVEEASAELKSTDWLSFGLSPKTVEIPSIGLSMHLPVDSGYTLKPQAVRRLEMWANDKSWVSSIDVQMSGDAAITVADVAKETVATNDRQTTNTTVLEQSTLMIHGQEAARLLLRMRPQKGLEEVLALYTIFRPQPQTFVVHGVWAKVSVAEEAMKTQRVVAGSIRFDDPAALAEARRLEVARMGKILAGLDRTAYEEMLIPSRWYRIYRTLESEVEGESGEIAEVAYYRIEERVGMLGEVNQAASSAMFTADERTEGLLVTLMSRYLLLGDGSTYIDVESTAWMSFDRTRERWSIRSATYVNDPNISEFLLAGRRTMTGDRRGDVIQIVRDFPPTPAETAQLRVPKESYLNHAEQYLLYRMIPRSEALTYGLYLYEPRLGRMAYRTESIRPGLVPESDSKRQKDADAHLVRLTNEGTIARLEMVNGDVTLPIKPSDLLAIWREKNLPTGKGSQKAAPPLLLEQMLEKKEMRMEKEEEETGGGRTNSGKRRR